MALAADKTDIGEGDTHRSVLEFSSFAQVFENVDLIRDRTDSNGYSLIRGVVPAQDVRRYRTRVEELYDPQREIRVSSEFERGSADIQRLDLGEYRSSSRYARYFFFFPWNNAGCFAQIGEAQMKLFNLLARQDETFGFAGDADPDRYRLTFVIQYPIGGGFMSRHREYSRQRDDKAYVIYLALTTRGIDFETGGGYVCLGDKLVDIENTVRAGDIVIYRGDYHHGVLGIDPHKPVQYDGICGRLMLTTIVRYLPKK
jgi:hypothetical protein